MTQIVAMFIALAGLCVLLYGLEWALPAVRAQPLWRPDSRTDLFYIMLTPFVTRAVSKLVELAALALMVHAVGHPDAQRMSEGFGPLIKQPPWLIVIEMLLIGDLLGYWIHRAFHTPLLWRFHAVHHSSTRLDWLSSMRVHPLNEVVSKLAPAVVMASLGFPLKLLAGYVSFLMLYAMLLHANVRWSFGPLRFVVASPLFHRWHHTTEEQGLSKNLAPLFPFIDRCFGTLQLPHNERPAFFGTIGTRVPEGFFAQLLFPFRKC